MNVLFPSYSAAMILDKTLTNKQLVAFCGELKKIHKELNLDDVEEGDWANTGSDDKELREDLNYVLEHYRWHVGYK